MSQPIIEVKSVVKEFLGGGMGSKEVFRALNNISFKLYKGRTLALVGESGCGKSTCARLITKCIHQLVGKYYSAGRTFPILHRGKNCSNTAVKYR